MHYQYSYGASGNLILRDTVVGGSLVSADRLYTLWDANGDITAITNASGTVEERYEYSPYGVVTVLTVSGSPVAGNVSAYGWQYLFQGGRQDLATGLYIFEHRDYNPTSGTWMQRDPIGLKGGDENLYRSERTNPIASRDRTGFSATLTWGWKVALGTAAADGPLPIGDTIAIVVIGGCLAYDVASGVVWLILQRPRGNYKNEIYDQAVEAVLASQGKRTICEVLDSWYRNERDPSRKAKIKMAQKAAKCRKTR